MLGVIRLSDLTDETTSPDGQRAKITTYGNLHDHKIVDWAAGLDVAGDVSPFDRPKLGPWLKRPDEWMP